MLLIHMDTLSYLRSNTSLLLFVIAMKLDKNQQIQIASSFVWSNRGSNPWFEWLAELEVSITPPRRPTKRWCLLTSIDNAILYLAVYFELVELFAPGLTPVYIIFVIPLKKFSLFIFVGQIPNDIVCMYSCHAIMQHFFNEQDGSCNWCLHLRSKKRKWNYVNNYMWYSLLVVDLFV